MSNCQTIRISGVLPSRLKKLYCISRLALPIFLGINLYCLSLGSDDIFFRTCHATVTACYRESTKLASSYFKNELEERSHPSKTTKHHPTKKMCLVGKTTTEAEVKTLRINCRE